MPIEEHPMATKALDAVERQALTYIVQQLDAGRTHVITDTLLPFLKSLDAGERLVAILTYFEALGILTPERPRGNHCKRPPLIGQTIPAYWRIEGKALILYRALEQKHEEHKSPEEGQRRSGRPDDTEAGEEFLAFPTKQRQLLKALHHKGALAIEEAKTAVYGTKSGKDNALDRLKSRTNHSLSDRNYRLEIKRKANTLSLQPL
jgi:hypothetical protein